MVLKGVLFFFLGLACSNSFALDKSKWMGELYQSRPDTPLTGMTIPRTHNAGTYKITPSSDIVPGESKWYYLGKHLVSSWAKTQYRTIYEQLELGIRSFDFRIALDVAGVPWIGHAMYSVPLKEALSDIQRFTQEHPLEVVLLTYVLETAYARVVSEERGREILQETTLATEKSLPGKVLPFSQSVTLKDFWEYRKSIVILNEVQKVWPNSYQTDEVYRQLDQAAALNRANAFTELQLIFTVSKEFKHFINPKYFFFQGPEDNCLSLFSADLRKLGPSWIRYWREMGYHLNLVATDFFDQFPFVESLLE